MSDGDDFGLFRTAGALCLAVCGIVTLIFSGLHAGGIRAVYAATQQTPPMPSSRSESMSLSKGTAPSSFRRNKRT